MKIKNILSKPAVIASGALTVGLLAGFFLPEMPFVQRFFPVGQNKLEVTLDIVQSDYVDTVNINDLVENAVGKLIAELDPHSLYIPADELEAITEEIEGEFAGVGIEYFVYADTMQILNIQRGSPAEQAGLMQGDRILTIADSIVAGPGFDEEAARSSLRGAEGTTARIDINRPGHETPLHFDIVRRKISVPTVRAAYEVALGIGMIKIYDSFSANTYNEFVNAMARLLAAGCKSFILDLRGNGGGVMDAAVNICNEFLPAESPIVLAQGKSFPLESVVANGLGTLISQPLVVLVDQLSASASEIIAGAIQDNDRGVIVGRRTFGKGLIQNQIELSDGSAIRLTVARYYTPSGRSIQRKYELGHSDDYALDWLDRFDNGEEFSADSIRQDTSVVYTTAHGRKVFGGGGIAPDVFVPLDTAEMTTYFMHLQNNDIFRIFGGYYSDRNRARLAEFKDWRQMLEYLKTQPLLYEITHFAEQYGIRRRSALISTSSRSIVRYACANILLNFFGEETFFIVAMNDDPVVQKAIEILQLDENIY